MSSWRKTGRGLPRRQRLVHHRLMVPRPAARSTGPLSGRSSRSKQGQGGEADGSQLGTRRQAHTTTAPMRGCLFSLHRRALSAPTTRRPSNLDSRASSAPTTCPDPAGDLPFPDISTMGDYYQQNQSQAPVSSFGPAAEPRKSFASNLRPRNHEAPPRLCTQPPAELPSSPTTRVPAEDGARLTALAVPLQGRSHKPLRPQHRPRSRWRHLRTSPGREATNIRTGFI